MYISTAGEAVRCFWRYALALNKVEKRRNFIINTVYTVIIIALFYLAVKYALGVVWPFVVAIFLAMLLQRPVAFLVRKTPLRRGIASVILVLFMLCIVGSVLAFVVYRVVVELRGFFDFLLMKLEDADAFATQIVTWLQNSLSFLPESLSESVVGYVQNFLNDLLGAEVHAVAAAEAQREAAAGGFDFSLLSAPLGVVWGTAKQIPMVLVGLLVCIVSCCFMTSDYHTLRTMILSQFPEKRAQELVRTKQIIFSTLGKMAKAYSAIICITCAEIAIGLVVLKLAGFYDGGYIFAIALITAIVDILPVLGTGTILIPWSLWSLFTGDIGFGIGLLVIYAIITVIRQVIEPKLVASQFGLPAFLTIMAMYVGTQLFGFIGLFLLPVTIMLLKVLNDEGIIHIFKKRDSDKAAVQAASAQGAAETKEQKNSP